ncbi:MAG: PH domain-containing protein [Clostridia bacterium]|nr:PH domain-containing protein [Clostridia bacterium]
MSYVIDNIVSKNENVLIEVERSKISLILNWIFGVLFFWLLFIPLINAIKNTINYKTTEYVITDKKAYLKSGWLNTNVLESSLQSIQDIHINQTFWGKILNYGTIVLESAKRSSIVYTKVKDYTKIKKQLNELCNI